MKARLDIPKLKLAGIALHEAGHFHDALYVLELAATQSPHDPSIRWHRSLVLLALGAYSLGWPDYEYRCSQLPEHAQKPGLFTYWPTVEMLRGRNVIVHAEQGIGDEIMFASCVPDLCKVAEHVFITCDRRLLTLFAQSFTRGNSNCVALGVETHAEAPQAIAAPRGDWLHVFAGSLPHAFRQTGASFPGDAYLKAESSHDFSHFKALNVGLCWRGGTVNTRGALRSIDAGIVHKELVRPVNDRVHFHCLQHDYQNGEPGYWGIAEWRELFSDFAALASYVKSLDLVVTVQCSIAHLAGALGVPCLVLLSAAPEWRYGAITGPESNMRMPWYRSVTLLRQERLGDWTRPLALARERVEALAYQKVTA